MNYASNQMHKLLKGWILNYLFKLSLQFLRKFYQFTWWKGQDSGNVCCNLYFFFPKIISVAQFSLLLLLFSHSVVSNSLQPWTAAHQGSLFITTPKACSNSCPSSRWCHPTISSSVIPFSSRLQSFIVQFSHPYMTTGKTIALTRWTFVDKVMSLLFNLLSSLVITFLPRSKHLLISWLQSTSAMILEPKKIESCK